MKRWIAGGALLVAGIVGAVGSVVALRSTRQAPLPPLVEPVERVAPRALMDGRPNVVLVVGCTLRRDQLTPYGAPAEISPYLHKMAGRGARFLHAVDAAPWTRAASTAIVTGHHAIELGMVEPEEGSNRRRLSPLAETLAERLQGAGYETVGLTANPNLNEVFGFAQGFDAYFEGQELWREGEELKPTFVDMAGEALRQVDDRKRPDAPLYLRIMTLDTHAPIEVSRRETRRASPDEVPPRVGAYRVEVQRWDEGLRQLWRGLRRRGYTEANTVVMVVNDHGEGLSWPPEHGHGHGNYVLPSTVDMPWIVWGHSIATGHLIDGVASQVDVHPTILGLTGVEGYAGPGFDWTSQVRGQSSRTEREFAFVDTWFVRASRAAIYTEDRLCIHDFNNLAEEMGRERMLPKTACFDRRIDPMARVPLPAVDEALIEQLMGWREARVADFEAWPDHGDIRELDPVMDQLEALGYVNE